MQFIKKGFFFIGAILLSQGLSATPIDTIQIQQAYSAFRQKQIDQLDRLSWEMGNSILGAYPVYWKIALDVQDSLQIPDAAMQKNVLDFTQQYPDTMLADRLLMLWLKRVGKNQDWQTVLKYHAAINDPDTEANCYLWQAQLNTGGLKNYDQPLRIWESSLRTPQACIPVMNYLAANQQVSALQAIERAYLLWRLKQETSARLLLNQLSNDYDIAFTDYSAIIKNPTTILSKNPQHKMTVLLALLRLSLKDTHQAVAYYQTVNADQLFNPGEQALFWHLVGFEGSYRLIPEAASWFIKAPKTDTYKPSNNTLTAWKARAGIRNNNWALTLTAISEMTPGMANLHDWIYWRAHALAMTNQMAEAKRLWTSLANQPTYYGILSAEEISQPIRIPPVVRATEADKQKIARIPGFQRAILLYEAGLRIEAQREWFFVIRSDMTDGELLAASELAYQKKVFDRAISAADQTKTQHNYLLRYPTPFKNTISKMAANYRLRDTWLYGLIRQESRFVTEAVSSAGASGLMQVMPATARWTAKRIGMSDFTLSQVTDVPINVELGSAYLDYVLDRFDRNLVPAIAGYNAGPGRPNQWRAATTLPGPVYIETIPFDETRDYVKKVLANVYLYELIWQKNVIPLKEMANPM